MVSTFSLLVPQGTTSISEILATADFSLRRASDVSQPLPPPSLRRRCPVAELAQTIQAGVDDRRRRRRRNRLLPHRLISLP